MAVKYAALALLCSGIFVTANRDPGRFEPLPCCRECVPHELIVAPAVGFDLTTSYGTAAIRFHNGSVVDVGQISADRDYFSLVKRLSSESTRPKVPNHDNFWDELRYNAGRARRLLNKYLGYPATKDVETLSKILSKLRSATEERLGHSISSAAVARPELPGLTREDLQDAMEYEGLQIRRLYNYFGDISETSAAFAGMGNGLCSNPGDIDICEKEELDMPRRYILAASLSNSSLSAVHTTLTYAHTSMEGKTILDFKLGLAALPNYSDSALYWSEVHRVIRSVAEVSRKPLDTVLILGERGKDETFLGVLRDALQGFQDPPFTVQGTDNMQQAKLRLDMAAIPDPLYVAARGAAEFAKRSQESPWMCAEPARCQANRDAIDEDWVDRSGL